MLIKWLISKNLLKFSNGVEICSFPRRTHLIPTAWLMLLRSIHTERAYRNTASNIPKYSISQFDEVNTPSFNLIYKYLFVTEICEWIELNWISMLELYWWIVTFGYRNAYAILKDIWQILSHAQLMHRNNNKKPLAIYTVAISK